MRNFCTVVDQTCLASFRALHRSLMPDADDYDHTALCLDAATEQSLRGQALPHVRLLPLAELTARHRALAAAESDRTPQEFRLTCKSWLLHHLLAGGEEGTLLTYIDSSLFFFGPCARVYAEIGNASIAIAPRRRSAHLRHLEGQGSFSAGWISLRNDHTGRACAARWARQCAEWCFRFPEADRFAEQKYLDDWPTIFPGVVQIGHPGFMVAPWNIAGAALSAGPDDLLVNQEPLICYDFDGLCHLSRQLYEPGLQACGISPDRNLREMIYHPYLLLLAGNAEERPDIVPPADPNDPRVGAVLSLLLRKADRAEQDRASTLLALAKLQSDAQQLVDNLSARERHQARYTRQVEQERDEQRQAFFDTRQKLEAFHLDLVRNVAYLKKLEAEAAAHRQAGIEREAYISSLKEQLAVRQSGEPGPDLARLHQSLAPHSGAVRRLLVARYRPAMLPALLCFSSLGVSIEVLDSPPELTGLTRGNVHFLPGSLWDWLGGLDSMFDESAYLKANPDIAAALSSGAIRSGWDHYQRFGQHEGRTIGTDQFRAGLPDFDAVAFDSADAGVLVPCLIGRLQPFQRLYVSSSFNPATVWLPMDTAREIVLDDLLCCPRPPASWLGPRLPSALSGSHHAPPTPAETYPATPSQQAVWPKITLVTVNLNQASGLVDTINSVLAQQYPNLEYIVVDRGSTDGSIAAIRQCADQLAWWTSEINTGHAESLNTGLAKGTGSIISWLGSGDLLAAGSLFTVAQQFLLHDIDLLAGRCALHSAGKGTTAIHRNVLALGQIQPLPLPEMLDLDRCWLPGWFFCQPEVFCSRRIWERVGGRVRTDLPHCPEYDLWLRMAESGARALAVPEILATHRISADTPLPAALDELRAVSAAYRSSSRP
ncbi:MAG: glycosyltransferase [Opitutales bacterium]